MRSTSEQPLPTIDTLLAHLPAFVYRCRNDEHWTALCFGERTLEVTGYPAAEFNEHRLHYAELIPPDDRPAVWAEIQAATAQQRVFKVQYRIVRADGQQRWVSEWGHGAFSAAGLMVREGFVTDVTEERESVEHARLLFTALPTAAWEEDFSRVKECLTAVGLVGLPAAEVRARILESPSLLGECVARVRILDVNDEALRLHQARDKRELLGGLDRLVVDESREALVAQVVAVATGQTEFSIDSKVRTLGGEARDVHIRWMVAPGSTASYGRVLVSTLDITERKRAEAEALRERNFNQAAIESLPGLFYVFDTEGRFVRWNRNFEVTSGYGEDVARMSPLDFFVEPDRTRVAERIAAGFATGEASLEANFVTKSGLSIPHFFTGRRFMLGEQPCLVGMGIDLTQRRQLEEQLLQSQKMDAIGHLAGGIAHDFNNLLTVIQGNTALLGDLGDEKVRAESIQEIADAAERAAGLTRQLLAFSRGQKLQRTHLDLNAIVANLAQMLRRVLGEDVRLECRVASRPLLARADAGMLDQVLMNLAVNARHAMTSGGVLTIETMAHELAHDELDWFIEAPAGSYVGLRVSDTGCGIRASDLPHVFEPFFTTREVGQGTGLGLSTVFGIVRQHAGTLRIRSEVGRGTTFEVLLPADASTASPARGAAALVSTPRQGRESILVVEDEARLRALFIRVLARHGYQVCEAGSGADALRQWDENGGRFELLVTDMLLPGGMSGAQVAVSLSAKQPALKVLYMSGYTGSAVSQGLELVEGINFLQKPFTPEALLEAVRRRLDVQ